ncbi:hypothetical protein [Sphingopyxis sp.]|uniref:hypothetical protein n=1 Tax=Sphingopyxis sp. TaxID=1908224 RepID=UPI003D0BAACC
MNHATHKHGGDWSTHGFVISVGLAVAVALTGYQTIATERDFDSADRTAPIVFNDPKAKTLDAAKLVAAQKHQLAWRPLSQDALNRLLVAARLDGRPALEKKAADAMRVFAWRTAPGQLNLITIALEQRKFDQVFQHADALSRRGKATEEILNLFALYELMPEKRQYLVTALKKSPPWRQAFLASAERLKSSQQVNARYETIAALLGTGVVQRDELSSLLGRMVATGSAPQAYGLWVKTQRPAVKPNSLFDGDFEQAGELQKSGVSNRFPFEWQLDSGRNAGTQLVQRGGSNELQLYWNGQGVPIFAKQIVQARPAVYKVTLHGVEASKTGRKVIAVELLCPGQPAIRLEPVAAATQNDLAFAADLATRCNYPEIRLFGRPDANGADFEMSLTGINLAVSS